MMSRKQRIVAAELLMVEWPTAWVHPKVVDQLFQDPAETSLFVAISHIHYVRRIDRICWIPQ